jgi:ACS family tartrate transporter-like MFS transporter
VQASHQGTAAPLRKVARRLIPFLWLLYFVAFLDRVNVSFAALRMNADLGLSATAYGAGAGVFFLGYVLFEVPSNLILARIGARVWIARIMVTWGIASAAMGLAAGPVSFSVLRFMLGVAEAGFFPGMILYLTYWFPSSYRGRVVAAFMMAIPLSNAIGSPISTALLGLDLGGIAGWRWLFVIEGLPAIVLGVVTYFYLTDKPEDAAWLDESERRSLRDQLDSARSTKHDALARGTQHAARGTISSPRTWVLGFIYFGTTIALYGFGFFLPQIIKGLGERSDLQVGVLTMIPYSLAAAAMYAWGHHSDSTGERASHLAIAALAAAVGLAASGLTHDAPVLAFCGLALASAGIHSALPTFWAYATAIGGADAAGIALMNSIGNLGGYFGPMLLGYIKDRTNGYAGGLYALAICIVAAGVLTIVMGNERAE